MKTFTTVVATMALGVTVMSAGPARARSVAAWSGAPENYSDATCFTESYASATNSACTSLQIWEIALPVDASGNYEVDIDVTPNGTSSNAGCAVYTDQQSGSNSYSSSVVYPSGTGAQVEQFTKVPVPSGGILYVGCFLKQGDRVNSVNWTQD